ncbi:iron-containing alcohol dehydrogenase family protein [Clostridium sp. BJN0001]|uniref:iron-containing alcohol dehydrogenase family protein n=1 Tax=Clostridium sp. BJN0001 TaxID=2930219 RepID=UPI001FD3C57C|nr:iron-containing alcohol dehydrogenase family protein [Clostridium sp. BJN0001]
MNNERHFFPNYSIGIEAYKDIPEVCSIYGKKAVIIGGKHALAAAAHKIREAIKGSDIQILGEFWYGGEASRENISMLNQKKEVQEADMIFACGGGKAMDTCKVLAQESNRPFFTFPTIASTCASCTSLGIIYNPDGSLREYSFQEKPARWIFINSQIIAEAPREYLWAGIGDTMAKYYECTTSARGDELSHAASMGFQISSLCASPLVKYGVKALNDCDNNKSSSELIEVILGIIISTGFVSNLVGIDLNTGLAHACYNGFTICKSVEEHHHLHGEIVAYGVLILLTVDNNIKERDKIFKFSKQMKFPTKLGDINASIDDVDAVIDKALAGIDVRKWPYKVNAEMIKDAILKIEKLN